MNRAEVKPNMADTSGKGTPSLPVALGRHPRRERFRGSQPDPVHEERIRAYQQNIPGHPFPHS